MTGHRRGLGALAALAVVALLSLAPAAWAADPASATAHATRPGAVRSGEAPLGEAASAEAGTPQLTPLLVAPLSRPVPVRGADGRTHLLYELLLTNATHGKVTLGAITVRAADGAVVAAITADAVATMLQPLGTRSATGTLASAQAAVLFVSLALEPSAQAPARLEHEIALTAEAVPVPGGGPMVQRAGTVAVDLARVLPVLAPPLEPGTGYLPADGCCTAVRHIRAGLPIDGRLVFAQRFAIDWEQIDDAGRFVNGDPADPASYTIYGKQVVAAADGRVVAVVDGLPNQVPGALPPRLPLAEVDGNSIVQDLGGGAFALYAHMQPGSIGVRPGQMLRRGEAIGLVGNSGNSSAPHLHFHVMDGPSPLGASGIPYVLDRFLVTGGYASTEVFDAVENTSEPLPVTAAVGEQSRTQVLPLDLSVVTFPR